MRWVWVWAWLLMVATCGQTGPLYLPDESDEQSAVRACLPETQMSYTLKT
ncbi:MAG: lipoprotein [Gammaproteobacteria bacterium]|nr:lipoprotein [Gammaproteobacteria bacterium]